MALPSPGRHLRGRIVASDRRLFRRIAGWRSLPLARIRRAPATCGERMMAALSRSADMAGLWLLLGVGLSAFGGRWGKRAAARGIGSIVATSTIANLALKPAIRRARPVRDRIPAARRVVRQPRTTSFPSAHAASAAAFAAGVAFERPAAGIAIAPLAAGVAYSRVYNGVHYPLDVAGGWILGLLVAAAGARLRPPGRAAPGGSSPTRGPSTPARACAMIRVVTSKEGRWRPIAWTRSARAPR